MRRVVERGGLGERNVSATGGAVKRERRRADSDLLVRKGKQLDWERPDVRTLTKREGRMEGESLEEEANTIAAL